MRKRKLKSSNYQLGRARENYVKQWLLKKGAYIVVRSGSSKSLIDLISIHPSVKFIWILQVKGGKKTPNLKSLREQYKDLTELEGYYEVRAGLVVKKDKKLRIELIREP